uniref:DNA-3-methyladenine glycosylase I n=1 Tax=Davidia involucrata TaxID=16924 RepID=A0A5B7AIE0_DAVIN
MSGPPRVRSMNCADSDSRPVLGPAGNKARSVDMRKPVSKPQRKVEKPQEIDEAKAKKAPSLPITNSSPSPSPPHCITVSSILKQQDHKLLKSNLSLNASCSSDASSDSSHSRASTGRISRRSVTPIRRKQCVSKTEKVVTDTDSVSAASADTSPVKKRCAWVTPNTDLGYADFHDKEWGVSVHDDKKLFELLILSTALAELTWPAILNKRHMFREVFLDFDPIAISKLNEKKIVTPGSPASFLLSELKLRGIIENARQTCKIIGEFGSFDKYIWGFVNHKPIVGQFRYPRQVPIKTSKADAISKDLVRRGFRGVGPTVIYSFMQVAGITNDHLISCFRFQECVTAADAKDKDEGLKAKVEEKQPEDTTDLGLARAVDDLSLSTV